MASVEEKTYLLCNYTPSRVVVSLKNGEGVCIERGRYDLPATYPFTLSEIQHINNTSACLRNGTLVPHEDCREFIYETLRIGDWKEILTNLQIEEIILNPTVEGLQKLLDIKDHQYFDRVYGVFLGLKNSDAPITSNVEKTITTRYRELLAGKRTSEITLRKTPAQTSMSSVGDAKMASIEEEISQLKSMMTAFLESQALGGNQPISDAGTTSTAPKGRTRKKATNPADHPSETNE
ncbi:MAG: hypothetical protein NC084_06240 [Bacteroides sp.]|nr:hypothetical protein [Eubacterium sp.]MCM1418175.1 hypothetical protein [Roseburia sp.]MCM1462300.1 hypothetical protein [Bacteroides sp.]